MIKLSGVNFTYPQSTKKALRDIDLQIHDGEKLVICGPSACGKSTLALAINGFLAHQYPNAFKGQVMIDEMEIRKSPWIEIAKKVGMVQQNPENQFCTLTVMDEIAFGPENLCVPPKIIEEKIHWALGIVSARHLLHKSLADLSGGEKQKVAIAAVLVMQPRILILDEPTSNLDPTATELVFKVIGELNRSSNMTIIIIEHKLAWLQDFCNRMIEMENGGIAYDGKFHIPENIINLKKGNRKKKIENETILTISNGILGYGNIPILSIHHLCVKRGEFIVVMGDNGAGKSTLLFTLIGLLKPIDGEFQLFGITPQIISLFDLSRRAGLIFQNPDQQIFEDSVYKEAVFALNNFNELSSEKLDFVEKLLSEFELNDKRNFHPFLLSFGEKRRLNLLAVLTYQPQLLLLDEIFIGQDLNNVNRIMKILQDYVHVGNTVLLVNHYPEIAFQYANRLLFLQNGKIDIDCPISDAARLLNEKGLHEYLPFKEREL